MAVRIEEEQDVLEENEDVDVEEDTEEEEAESVQPDSESEDEEPGGEDDDEDDRVVTIGEEEADDEDPHGPAPAWVKKVRKANRKLESENRRLKRELQERSTEKQPAIELGEKPTLKSCKYDDKKYEQELTAYYDRKRKLDEIEAKKAKIAEEQQKQWKSRQERYATLKAEHGFKDFDEAEELVTSVLDVTRQGVIVHAAEDSALVVYALGKNPKKLEELSRVTDPVAFAAEIGRLESKLKVTSKKAPAPETRVSAGKSAGLGGSGDSTLERLRREADKTGDYTKVIQYKAKLRQKKDA